MKPPEILVNAIKELTEIASQEYDLHRVLPVVQGPGYPKATICYGLVRHGVAGAYLEYLRCPNQDTRKCLRALLSLVWEHAMAVRTHADGQHEPIGALASAAFIAMLAMNYRDDLTDLP